MGMRYIGIRIHLHRLQFLVMIKLFDYMIKNGRLFISSKRLLRFFFPADKMECTGTSLPRKLLSLLLGFPSSSFLFSASFPSTLPPGALFLIPWGAVEGLSCGSPAFTLKHLLSVPQIFLSRQT